MHDVGAASAHFARRPLTELCVMAATKRRTVIALTLGASLAAVGSAAALTYDLNRPSHTRLSATQHAAQAAADPCADPQVLCIPTITIVARPGEPIP